MSVETKCPSCGTEISADAIDGLCLKCLGRLGFFPDSHEHRPDVLLRLGDYALLEEIARGGMGVVYRARQVSLNRIVALKVLLHGPFSSAGFVRRFKHEAQVVAALQHPNIVAIHEVGESHGSHFLALDYIEGRNFAEVAREQPLPARRAAGDIHYRRARLPAKRRSAPRKFREKRPRAAADDQTSLLALR